jgi:hypothetical protein
MDKARAWLQDRKNLPIVAAGTAIILILVILLFLKMNGTPGGGYAGDTAGTASPGMYGDMGMPSGTQPGMPNAGTAGPGMSGAGSAVSPQAAAPAPTAQASAKLDPMLPYRKDPFQPITSGKLRTRKSMRNAAIALILPSIQRPRLAPLPVWHPEGTVAEVEEPLPPQPFRRMAGVMINGRISAILETAGEADIVAPGMVLSRGGSKVKVESVSKDQIILKTLDTKKPISIKVNLAGSTVGDFSGDQVPGMGPGSGIYTSGPPSGPAIY